MNFAHFNNLKSSPKIDHFIATRKIGNVSFSASENKEEVLFNRGKVAHELGIRVEDFAVAGLVHGDNVVVVSRDMKGRGAESSDNVIAETDALITKEKGILLMIPVADCVPILLFDPENIAIGIIHAGWRGTIKNIASKTVSRMKDEFATNPAKLKVGIGPCICVKHYEVDEAVLPSARGHLDLRMANKLSLISSGVEKENIEVMDYCTYEKVSLFYSHRREGRTGRFATGIIIK